MQPSGPGVSSRMARQRERDTGGEVALRKALHRRGLRFRTHVPVPGRPRRQIDIAFPGAKVAVFVDGCFWHRCPEHRTFPRSNAAWWDAKLAANVTRDADTDEALREAGWTVVRVWEHVAVDEAADRVAGVVALRREAPRDR